MFPMQKRAREPDGEDEPSNTEKKPRTLAFRTSPTIKHPQLSSQNFHHSLLRSQLASNMTPPQSSGDEPGQRSYPKDPPSLPSPPNDPHDDYDMDMADAQPALSPYHWEGTDMTAVTPPRPVTTNLSLETPTRDSHEAAHGGRVATPRWGYFRSKDIRMELCDVEEDDFPDGSVPSHLEWNHRALLRRRRLPSPVGEETGMMSSPAATGVSLESSKWVKSEGCNATPIEQSGILTDSNVNDRKGTSTPGKTMLAMGYRADCEKCRTRVPGHYNHVIRTW